uniref:Uncharacterized protein n=1 Tax=Rhizophora mucronata TaxID=61149 RepID=A0A2P2IMG5_RHIMU
MGLISLTFIHLVRQRYWLDTNLPSMQAC